MSPDYSSAPNGQRLKALNRYQRGVTLVEMLVGLVIALVVMGGAFAAYLAVANSSRTNIRADRINIDVQTILDIMANDIRRAGYWATPGTGNPFSPIFPTSGTSTCFLYSYDANDDGTKDADELFGFRVSNQTVQIRTAGTSDTDCNDGTWQPLSDPNLMRIDNATGLVFTITTTPVTVSGTGLTVERRFVNVRLLARSSSAADDITKVAQTSVEIRNDRRTP